METVAQHASHEACVNAQETPDPVQTQASGEDQAVLRASFYEGVDVTKLEDEDFEEFWARLGQRNAGAFACAAATQDNAADSDSPDAPVDDAALVPRRTEPDFMPDVAPLEYDEAIARLHRLLDTRPLRKEIFRRTLEACLTRRDFAEAEALVSEFPQFRYDDQTPYQFIKSLIDAGGLQLLKIGEEGQVLYDEAFVGLTVDEADDIIASFSLEATEAGRAIAEELSPKKALSDLLAKFPDRAGVYRDLLSFVESNHCNYAQIEALFKGRDFSAIKTIGAEKRVALQPSVFVDNLERAGGLVWQDGGWCLTSEGKALLKELLGK